MAYTPVKIIDDIKKIGVAIAQAKTAGTFDGNETYWDDQVIQAALSCVRQAIAQNQQSNKVTRENGLIAKKVVDDMESLVKKRGKKLSDADLEVIETGQRTVQRAKRATAEDSKAVMAALKQYRDSWDLKAQEFLTDKDRVDEPRALRATSIAANKQADAILARLDEYEKRIAVIVKTAQALAGQGAGDAAATVESFGTEATASLKTVTEKCAEAKRFFTQLASLTKSDVATPSQLKIRQSSLQNAQLAAKEARGAAKTLELAVVGFKKTAAGFDGAAKSQRDTVLKDVLAKAKPAQSDLKKLETLEKDAVKHLAKLAK